MKYNDIEKFIDDVVKEAEEETGFNEICIDNIGEFYPNEFDQAVECCIMNTFWWDDPGFPFK